MESREAMAKDKESLSSSLRRKVSIKRYRKILGNGRDQSRRGEEEKNSYLLNT